MSTAASAGMQAALLIREKQRLRKKRRRADLPSHVATREIEPFPQFPSRFMCSQGRAAWQERERGRRCSLSDEARQHRLKQNEAHHRWMKRNRIHDTTYGGSSEEEDFFDVYHQSAAANALLYVGLGTVAIGAVIFFVGTGEKGFKTLELRLIGPTLVACGLLCCLVRVLLCACPSTCLRGRKKARLKNVCPHGGGGGSHSHPHHHHGSASRCPLTRDRSADACHPRTTHASTSFEKHKKKVSIVTGGAGHAVPGTSSADFQDAERAPMLASVQTDVAAGGTDVKTLIPIITIPDDDEEAAGPPRVDSLIELDHLDAAVYDLQSISSYESETVIEIECRPKESKHTRGRAPVNATPSTSTATAGEDTIVVVEPRRDSEAHHSGIVLSPLQLGQ